MNRREFVKGSAVAAAAGAALSIVPDAMARGVARNPLAAAEKFKLRYAFDAGQFSNHAPGGVVDELKFAADNGFTAMEDNRMKGRPVPEQEAIAKEMQRLGMTMGIFILNQQTGFKGGGSLTTGKPEERDAFLAEVKSSIEVAKRVNAKWLTSLVGMADLKLPFGYQMANVIDCLRRASDLLEPHGIVMVFEPLNIIENHPGFFIHSNDGLYALMKSVRSPSCKMLYDLYHSQISEGHLIYNFDRCFDEIGYVQTGDTPGRKEPGTGEVNYRNVFKFIYDRGYTGLLGMEHGKSLPGKEGELALIKSYRDADSFVPAPR
ncbi:MAG: TIM barrel protein [bacterium]